jgi:hypothetical protein
MNTKNSKHKLHGKEYEVAIEQLVTAADVFLHTRARAHTHTRTRARAHAHTHTHTHKKNPDANIYMIYMMINAIPGLQREHKCVNTFT